MKTTRAFLIAAGLALTLAPSTAQAQVSLTTSSYSQNFNTLPSTSTASVTGGNLNNVNTALNGWYFLETGSGANTTITAATGSGTGGDTYSFGSASNSDRSLGSLQ
ncbi:MAG: hemolysin, partial [Opitutia bacterium]